MATIAQIWQTIKGSKTVARQAGEIKANRVLATLDPSVLAVPQKSYFGIVVEELFLEYSRKWYSEFDPVVLAFSEFVYGGKIVSVPYVVGPKALGDASPDKLPQGMLYKRTRVAGIHPFRGGRVVSSVVLCQVRRANYASKVLKFVEGLSGAVPFAAELGTYVRYADSLLDGVDALLGVNDTEPLVGLRQEFDYDLGEPIKPAYFALIDAPESKIPLEHLWIRDGSLHIGNVAGNIRPFRDSSYVLLSTRIASQTSEIDTLPVAAAAREVIDIAASADAADWSRAKAELVVLLRSLLASPDLTRDQALSYHARIVEEAKDAHSRAISIGNLSANSDPAVLNELRAAAMLLELQ